MIKWKTTGYGTRNDEARELRDASKHLLKGMNCRKCGVDTVIGFVDDGYGYLTFEINACCSDFKTRIEAKLQPNKYADLD